MIQNDLFSLNKKKILITGASSGIGRQCAISCSERGATLVLLGRDQPRLNETLAMTANSSKHVVFSVDLSEYDKAASVVSTAVNLVGKFDGLVNCAGISTTLPLNAVSTDKLDYYLKTNVIAPLNLTKEFVKAKHVSESGASIVFISSVMGVVGEKGKTIYASTKGALLSAVKSLAVELAARTIRVNAISPGVVISPMSQNAVYNRDSESLKRITELHPLGLGRPEDIANLCIFLLSDASRWITGSNLIADGGYTAR